MQYMLLIYSDPKAYESLSEDDNQAVMNEYFAFTEEIRASGEMVSGEALQPASATTAVRVEDGKTLTTDGPYVETKEVLGGYYTVEVKDLDRAVEIAAKIPDAARGLGVVEVRPVVVFS